MSRCADCRGQGWTVEGWDPPSQEPCAACGATGSLNDAAGLAGMEGWALFDAAGFGWKRDGAAMELRIAAEGVPEGPDGFRVFLDWPETPRGSRDPEAVFRAAAAGPGMPRVCLETRDRP